MNKQRWAATNASRCSPSWSSPPCQERLQSFLSLLLFSSLLPAHYLCSFFLPSVFCPKRSRSVILAYPPPPGPPCRNNERLCSNIVPLRVKIRNREKQERHEETARTRRCVRACVWACIFWAWRCESREHEQHICGSDQPFITSLSAQEVSRHEGCVMFGGQSRTRQDMRWQRHGSSTLCLAVTLYLSENNNTPALISSTDGAPAPDWMIADTHDLNQAKQRWAEAVAACPGVIISRCLRVCSVWKKQQQQIQASHIQWRQPESSEGKTTQMALKWH